MENKNIVKKIMYWLPRVVAAGILLQSVPMKLAEDPMVVGMFEKLNILGTGGRLALLLGIFELVAGIFILIPKLSKTGAGLGAVIMAGAVYFHVTALGTTGAMFIMAIVALLACLAILFMPHCKSCCGKTCEIKK